VKNISVESFGPISNADIVFGDLTVFVGPQASGKSLLMQLIKAMRDASAVRKDLLSYGFD
jgi:predicted ATPase